MSSGVLNKVRGLWLEAELAAPGLMSRVHALKEVARLVLKPRLTTYLWDGHNAEGRLRVSYTGWGYARLYLRRLLFEEAPREERVGQISAWTLSQQLGSVQGDIAIVECSKYVTRRLLRQGGVTLPFRLQHILYLRKEWNEVLAGFSKSVRGQDMRRVRKYSYSYSISHQYADFENFYHQMYVPTTLNRHGELASVTPLDNLYHYLRRGFMILVERDGRVVSAGLCSIQGGIVFLAASGVIDCDQQLMREGAMSAIYYFLSQWIHEHGYEGFNLGFCWPFIDDGIFQSKRKWGATVLVPPREHKQLWLGVRHDTPAVQRCLSDNPFVIVDARGELQGLVVKDNVEQMTADARSEWQHKYETPGLRETVIGPATGLLV